MGKNLTQRVQQNQSNQVAQREPQTMAQFLEQMKPQFARALPKHMDPDRIARIALTLFNSNRALQQCTPQSFMGALLTATQLGLEPGPLGEAYLVPYGGVCTFIPGYRGLIKLAWQSGQLKSIAAHTVHEGDEFDYAYGLDPVLRHKPTLGNRGEVIAVYAAAVMKDGGSAFVVMSRDDVEEVRKRSKAGKNGPWVSDWEAMARKTAVKQLIRWLPLSTELRNLAVAAQLDETTRTDMTHQIDEQVPEYLTGEVVETEHGPTNTTTGEVHNDVPTEEPPEPNDGWGQ